MRTITKLALLFSILLITNCTVNDGIDGLNSLILVSPEAAGSNCPTGGLKVDSGLDSNANGVLDTGEILTTNYICSGVNSLINVFDELAGGTCQNGGIRIESGLDSNGNGTLDSEEVQMTRFLCNADGGGFDEQIRLNFEFYSTGSFASTQDGILVGTIPNFDKNSWSNIDSIVFAARIVSYPPSTNGNSNPNNKVFAQVYDTTNNQLIANSLIESDEQYDWPMPFPEFIYSENIYNFLPEEEINLSILLRSETEGDIVYIFNPAYLFLYRSH